MELPIKRSARLVLLDPRDRLLLFRYHEPARAFWATAGGRLEPGETYLDAARRELREETGFDVEVGRLLCNREGVFSVAGGPEARWIEEYFLVECAGGTPDRSGWTDEERTTIREFRWWSADELRATTEVVLPPWLPELFDSVLAARRT
jgi:ADP-ribose pyrophosphatase YjhB (NUDIX family)